jgi:hypothetical protein
VTAQRVSVSVCQRQRSPGRLVGATLTPALSPLHACLPCYGCMSVLPSCRELSTQYQALVVEQKALTEDEFWSSSAMLKVAGVAGGPALRRHSSGPLSLCVLMFWTLRVCTKGLKAARAWVSAVARHATAAAGQELGWVAGLAVWVCSACLPKADAVCAACLCCCLCCCCSQASLSASLEPANVALPTELWTCTSRWGGDHSTAQHDTACPCLGILSTLRTILTACMDDPGGLVVLSGSSWFFGFDPP